MTFVVKNSHGTQFGGRRIRWLLTLSQVLLTQCFISQPAMVSLLRHVDERNLSSSGTTFYRSSPSDDPHFVPEETLRQPSSRRSSTVEEALIVNGKTQHNNNHNNGQSKSQQPDPSMVEFVPAQPIYETIVKEQFDLKDWQFPEGVHYPFALMMQGCAPYIAAHAGQTAVFHIPGEWLGDDNELVEKTSDRLFSDMAIAWLLGMRLVIVVGCRYDMDSCDVDFVDHPHECHNSLKVTDTDTLRRVEEEAGYLRTEVERKLNRCLRLHGGAVSTPENPAPEGNVVSGNSFYTARLFGNVRGEDFEHTGFTTNVHTANIERTLKNNDIVLLTTVGSSPQGDLVHVNGYHLAATVAASLDAYKLIYLSNEGTVLQSKKDVDAQGNPQKGEPIQELSLSFAQSLLEYHQVQVHKTGFATFEHARQSLPSGAVELLLHLGWASWGLLNGVKRAHVVNPGDGALLEELFTSKNGANTCLYHDVEENDSSDGDFDESELDSFFASADKHQPGESSFRYY